MSAQAPRALREDDVVAAIAAMLESDTRVLLGIGDDAAVWQPSRSHRSVITTDMLVEGVHFHCDSMTLEDAGWRAMAANVSDLAAMGARPVLATVALGMPPGAGAPEILQLYRGLAECAQSVDIAIAGGDLSRAPVWTVSIGAVGEVRASNVKTRAGGRPGDIIAVTGPLGASRAGLDIASGAVASNENIAAEALRAFRRPQPRLAEGRFLAASRNVATMMDCSDGLSTDLARLCAAAGCGARIESVPVAPAARAVAEINRRDPERYALDGGEDFELIVGIRPRAFAFLQQRFARRFGRELLRVGRLAAEPGAFYQNRPLEAGGWDHFAQ